MSTEEAEEKAENQVYQKYGINGVLRDWTRRKKRTIERFTQILRAIRENEVTVYQDVEDLTGINKNSVKTYCNDDTQLGACVEKVDGEYQVTPVGKEALTISWGAVFQDL